MKQTWATLWLRSKYAAVAQPAGRVFGEAAAHDEVEGRRIIGQGDEHGGLCQGSLRALPYLEGARVQVQGATFGQYLPGALACQAH